MSLLESSPADNTHSPQMYWQAEDTPPVKSVQHWKISETGDGGSSTFLPGWPSTDPRWRLVSLAEMPRNVSRETSLDTSRASEPRRQNGLVTRCPPNSPSHQAQSPWPDLLIPYHSGSSDNPENDTWWLREDNTKYLAEPRSAPAPPIDWAVAFPSKAGPSSLDQTSSNQTIPHSSSVLVSCTNIIVHRAYIGSFAATAGQQCSGIVTRGRP